MTPTRAFAMAAAALIFAACSGDPNTPDPGTGGGENDQVEQWNAEALKAVQAAGPGRTEWRELMPGSPGWFSEPHQNRWVVGRYDEQAMGNFKSGSPYLAKSMFWLDGWQTQGKEQLRNHFVMRKMPAGYDEAYGNWYYAKLDGGLNVVFAGNSQNPEVLNGCISCHAEGAKGTDYIFEP